MAQTVKVKKKGYWRKKGSNSTSSKSQNTVKTNTTKKPKRGI